MPRLYRAREGESMSKKCYKICFFVLLLLSVAAALAHFVWAIADDEHVYGIDGFLLNLLPYGLPILTFALVWRGLKKEQPCWCMADTVLGVLFSLSFIAMAVHVTIAGALQGMANVYFNLPVIYAVPLCLFALIWLAVRLRPQTGAVTVQKVLYALPVLPLAAMVVHCGILCVTELSRDSMASSAPWWVLPLAVAMLYLCIALLLLAVYVVYCAVLRRRQKKAAKKAEN